MKRIQAFTHTIEWLSVGKKVLSFLLFTLVAFLFLYGYFVSTSVVNVLVRKEIERDIAAVSSTISDLEAEYLAAKNEITLEFAVERGFYSIADKHFATRASGLPRSLTLSNE